jgi:hypothetical protein
VSDRSGAGLVELAVLQTLEALTAGRPRAHVSSARAVAGIEERIGLGPKYGYELLADLARPWMVYDLSTHDQIRIGLVLEPGTDPAAVRDQVAAIDGITLEHTWAFPAPLVSMLRSWVDRHRPEDITASLDRLRDAIRRDRRRKLRNR